mgnify:CR=1 FL=1
MKVSAMATPVAFSATNGSSRKKNQAKMNVVMEAIIRQVIVFATCLL